MPSRDRDTMQHQWSGSRWRDLQVAALPVAVLLVVLLLCLALGTAPIR